MAELDRQCVYHTMAFRHLARARKVGTLLALKSFVAISGHSRAA
jgi:hypothetical protein